MATNLIQLPQSYNSASPQIIVDVYNGTQGDSSTIVGNTFGVLRAEINKNIRERSGTFKLILAPGGPDGINGEFTWTSVIVPFSMAVIALKRAESRAIVMAGIITNVREVQQWNKDKVIRLIEITGVDFSVYFTTFAYYVWKFLGILQTLPELLGPAGSAGTNYPLGVSDTTPDKVGLYWYNNVIMGTDANESATHPLTSIFSFTTLNYKDQFYKLRQLMGSFFEPYDDEVNVGIIIPMSIDFLLAEGDLYSKFTEIFPFPFYETFILTSPASVGGIDLFPDATDPQIEIVSSDSSIPSANPFFIARVNPLPWVSFTDTNKTSWRTERWNALPTYDFTTSSFIESDVMYQIEDIRNFYVLSPLSPLTMTGNSLSTVQGAIEQFGFMIDQYSISKYGYRPEICNVMWWVDPFNTAGVVTKSPNSPLYPSNAQYADMISKISSYYEPTPNMLYGLIKIPMWPELFPGNRIKLRPFKNTSDVYLFYIEGVSQVFEFGGNSYTELSLTRGLLDSDYSNSNNIMIDLHTGNADRVDGDLLTRKGNILPGLSYNNLNGSVDIFAAPFNSPHLLVGSV